MRESRLANSRLEHTRVSWLESQPLLLVVLDPRSCWPDTNSDRGTLLCALTKTRLYTRKPAPSYRAGTSQSCSANFQKLNLALLAILISWAVFVMVCRHGKTQQAPCLEVVGPYGRYCLIRQLGNLLRQPEKLWYLRSDNFTLRSKFTNRRFSLPGVPQAGQQGLRVWRHVDKMPSL